MGRSPIIFNIGDTGSSQHGGSEFMGESSVVKKGCYNTKYFWSYDHDLDDNWGYPRGLGNQHIYIIDIYGSILPPCIPL